MNDEGVDMDGMSEFEESDISEQTGRNKTGT
jgi:hypothetical protein